MSNERMVTMTECPGCGLGIQASKSHECDPRVRTEHIATLRRKLDDQYEIARQEYKENSQLRGRLNKMKATWLEALDLWKRMRATIEQQRDSAGVKNADLRARLAEALNGQDAWKIAAQMWERSCCIRREREARLREQLLNERNTGDMVYAELVEKHEETKRQLAEARNKALDEATAKCAAVKAHFLEEGATDEAIGAAACSVRIALHRDYP